VSVAETVAFCILAVDFVKAVVQVISCLCDRLLGRRLRFFWRFRIKEVFVLLHLRTSCHREQRVLVLLVLFLGDVVLDKEFFVFLLKKIEPVDFLLKIRSERVVSEDKFLDCLVFLASFHISHFIRMNNPFKHLNLLSQLGLVASL
jgi:hypothetical protein